MARPISIGYPSGKLKMVMWAGTEDAESFPIISPNSAKPYVRAYGVKHYLTEEETQQVHTLLKLIKGE